MATFIGSPKMNLLPAVVSGGAAQVEDFGALPLEAAEGPLSVGARPEQIILGKGGELTTEGTVTLVEYLGSEIFLYVRLASGRILLAKASGGAAHKVGERLPVSIAARSAHYFDANGQRLPLFDNQGLPTYSMASSA